MSNDRVQVSDGVYSAVSRGERVPSIRPCVQCLQETVDHHPVQDTVTGEILTKRIICTNPTCRAIAEVIAVEKS
jgi:hypothetical protein